MKYIKLFEDFSINEFFGLGKKQETPSEDQKKADDLQKLKSKIQQVFPESIYGDYLNKLPIENVRVLYSIIDNNNQVMDNSTLLSVLNGKEELREQLEKERISIYWLKALFSIVENGSWIDRNGKKFTFDFLVDKEETSYKQIMNNIKSKSDLIPELVGMSREKKQPINKILSDKL
jgi:hypothetical protein